MSDFPVDRTAEALRIALGQASRRTEVVAANLANLDTPGYRALEVEFDEALSSADRRVRGKLVEAPITRMRSDGNTVDVDREMTELSKSAGRYRSAAEMLRKRFALLTYAATDGRSGG